MIKLCSHIRKIFPLTLTLFFLSIQVIASDKVALAIFIGDSLSAGYHPDVSSEWGGQSLPFQQETTHFINGSWAQAENAVRFGPPFFSTHREPDQLWHVIDDEQNISMNANENRTASPVYGWSSRIRAAYAANMAPPPSQIYAIQLGMGTSHAAENIESDYNQLSWNPQNSGTVNLFEQLDLYHIQPLVQKLLDQHTSVEFIGVFGSIAGGYIRFSGSNPANPQWLDSYGSDLSSLRQAFGELFHLDSEERDSFPFVLSKWHNVTDLNKFPLFHQIDLTQKQLLWEASSIENNVLVDVEPSIMQYGLDLDEVHYTEGTSMFLGRSWADELRGENWHPVVIQDLFHRVIYVDRNAVGSQDGSSFQDAYLYLQDALIEASVVNERYKVLIAIAEGVYQPEDKGTLPSFKLPSNVTLRGGYKSSDSWKSPTGSSEFTIISRGPGNFDPSGLPRTGEPLILLRNVEKVEIEGLSIRDGSITSGKAAGLVAINSGLKMEDVHFSNHSASLKAQAAGMLWKNSISERSLRMINCSFIDNSGALGAGALKIVLKGTQTLEELVKIDGLRVQRNKTRDFQLSREASQGGGVSIVLEDSSARISIMNALITDNKALGKKSLGGGVSIKENSLGNFPKIQMTGVTIANNQSARGGGIYAHSPEGLLVALDSSIVHQNESTHSPLNDLEMDAEALVQASYSCTGDIVPNAIESTNSDPLFENMAAGNYSLSITSPLINAGNPLFKSDGLDRDHDSNLSEIAPLDVLGQERISSGQTTIMISDMGAIERQ